MTDPRLLVGETLYGGFVIVKVDFSDEPMTDAIRRAALARTGVVGRSFDLTIQTGLSDKELSVTLYHEILEAASMAAVFVPPALLDFGEAEFDSAAYRMHAELGGASLETLNRMWNSSALVEIELMSETRDIRIELIKLRSGERVIRLAEQHSGLSLEKTVDNSKSVVRQKNELLSVFQAALDRAELTAA